MFRLESPIERFRSAVWGIEFGTFHLHIFRYVWGDWFVYVRLKRRWFRWSNCGYLTWVES